MRMNTFIQRHATLPARILLIAMICSLLAACAGRVPFRSMRMPTDPGIQWPPAPLPATVSWVRNVSDYPDAGITKSTWKYLTDFVFGAEESAIGRPYGILMDSLDRLFIVDVVFRRVHVMDVKENRYTVIGEGKQGVFQMPIAIAADDSDNVYITDSEAGIVYRHNLRTKVLSPFITGLIRPTGIAFNKANRLLYVSETGAHQVVLFDLNGKERLHIGRRGEAPGQFNFPTDLFIDKAGKLYVTDPINARIQVFSAEGKFLLTFGRAGDAQGEFSKPKGVAVDSEGNIYVCDALRDSVQVFDSKGRFLLEFGERGQDSGTFWMPSGIYIDKEDMIYVADTYNRRIQVFRHTGRTAPAEKRPGLVTGK
jgi:DNA-binding beta-propeller fold protein YncE